MAIMLSVPLIYNVIEETARAKNESIPMEDAVRLVADECKQSLRAAPLWYNSSSRLEIFASHPKQNRSNSHLVTLIDYALPNWEKCPPRSTSFLLTSKPIYTIAHRAFPIDGAQLVVAPSMYFGGCFKIALERLHLGSVDAFDSILTVLHSVFNMWSKRKEGKSIGATLSPIQINQFITNAQSLLDNWPNLELMFDRAAEHVDEPEDVKGKARAVLMIILKNGDGELITGLNRIFDPSMNGFKLTSISEFTQDNNCEIWTDSPCVMVRNDVLGLF